MQFTANFAALAPLQHTLPLTPRLFCLLSLQSTGKLAPAPIDFEIKPETLENVKKVS